MHYTNNIETNKNNRIDYIDILKGFAILWIVWYHQPHPVIVDHYFHVPLFFFISGIFFKHKNPKAFFKSLVFKIIIPFLFFYIISYGFQIARFLFENATIKGFEWTCILDVFRIESYIDHITINRPLWFLISLTVIQLLYYFIGKLPKLIIITLCTIIIFLKEPICATRSPFMINQSIFWLLYYALGDTIGKIIISNKKDNKHFFAPLIICICTFIFLSLLLPHIENTLIFNIAYEICVISFVILSVILFSFFRGRSHIAKVLKFYGQNSLIVLSLHLLVSILYGGIFFRIIGITGNNYIGFANFILTAITLYPIIILLNKHLPFCVGKYTTPK